QRRGLLVVSCVSLGAALLSSEGVFPLALLGPLLLGLVHRERRGFVVWCCAWCGTLALPGLRLLLNLLAAGDTSYQVIQASQGFGEADVLLRGLALQLRPLLSYFEGGQALREHWPSALLALAAATLLVGRAAAAVQPF